MPKESKKIISKEKVDELINQAKSFFFGENMTDEEKEESSSKLVHMGFDLFGFGCYENQLVDNLVLMHKSNTTIYKVLNVIGYKVE